MAEAQKDEEAFSRGHKSGLAAPRDKTQGSRGRGSGGGERRLGLGRRRMSGPETWTSVLQVMESVAKGTLFCHFLLSL